ncbi:aminoacyl-tRNA hydrolase [Spiroplasma alleghenense]|uniref:Peptidyl-tRNA hydrolase n=1 Tax=Spiroplasma alleghenense TaxID=216931 RepID=A0A345Z2R6_9MOLU|nr:aminoacyl-tRNA hydrolase [Spiroplasma alleghenense]AXK50895.1 peptidyl-tRNA hydrolase [Spiroplasma alleghenense]
MKIIFGLGNPGTQYLQTRHNAGFLVLDQLIEYYNAESIGQKFKSEIYSTQIHGEKVLFVKPLTFMNLSGEAVLQIMHFYKVDLNQIVIIHDEKDFPIEKQQFKNSGSAAGHNGLKNIITHFHTTDFQRLRIGIGNPEPGWKIVDWVLSKMSTEEIKKMNEIFNFKINWVKEWISGTDFKNIMNKYN